MGRKLTFKDNYEYSDGFLIDRFLSIFLLYVCIFLSLHRWIDDSHAHTHTHTHAHISMGLQRVGHDWATEQQHS